MRLSRESLERKAAATGFRADMLEKVFLLLELLESLNRHPTLAGKLALKGGTALNLFLFDVPRLSVDIDLNYIGAEDREGMQSERPALEQAVELVARRLGLTPQTPKGEQHAGRSWTLRYGSALGGTANLKVDLIYTLRVPLWTPVRRDSRPLGSRQAKDILLLDNHELAAGKLAALLARRTSRDLFDAHALLRNYPLEAERLRIAFVAYGAMNVQDWRGVTADDIAPATRDLATYLRPLLRDDAGKEEAGWGERLVSECRAALSVVLPLRENERVFLERLLSEGILEPERLTEDTALAERLRRHPALLWKARNVRQHRTKTT